MAQVSTAEQRPAPAPAADSDAQHFAYIASHDLNAPLRAVSGFIELFMLEYADRLDEQGLDWIKRAADSTRKLQGMLEDLRVYSRLKPFGVSQQIALDEIFADVELELAASIRDGGAQIERDGLPTVQGDRAQLTLLARHLIDNAVKFHSAEPPRVRVTAQDSGDRWQISVSDNGLGIDSKHHARIFEMFKRLQGAAFAGSGVGLTLVRRIVQLHGGEIWVESEVGRGTTFFLTLVKGNPG